MLDVLTFHTLKEMVGNHGSHVQRTVLSLQRFLLYILCKDLGKGSFVDTTCCYSFNATTVFVCRNNCSLLIGSYKLLSLNPLYCCNPVSYAFVTDSMDDVGNTCFETKCTRPGSYSPKRLANNSKDSSYDKQSHKYFVSYVSLSS